MTDPQRPVRDIQPAPSTSTSITQHGPLPIKILLVLLSVIVLVVSLVGYATIGRLGNEIASASNLSLGDGGNQRGPSADGAVDILLVGTDSRTDAQGNPLSEDELARLNAGVDDGEENTDTMMVIRVPDDGSSATAVSLPRDTYVHDEEFGNMKLNGIYAAYKHQTEAELVAEEEIEPGETSEAAVEAGRSGLIDIVGEMTGVDIDHYAEVGLHGFVQLTDAVNGVEVCLNNPVDEPMSGAKFPAGEQTLNGLEALSFVRQRHGLPRNDLDRIVRQQAYMASLVNKVLSAGTLTNPSKLSNLAGAVERSVVIDDGWDIVSFANQFADLAGGNVSFTTIPVTSVDGTGDYGESIVTVNPEEVRQFFDDMAIDPEEEAAAEAAEESGATEAEATEEAPEATAPPELEGFELHVLNAGQLAGLADNVGAWLEEQGTSVVEVSNAQPGIYYTSQIVAADPADPAAVALSEMMGDLPITANAGLDATTLIVVAADDYAGPTAEPVTDPNEAAGTDTGAGAVAGGDTAANEPTTPVGTPGADFGQAEVSPEIDAGGTGPRCVN